MIRRSSEKRVRKEEHKFNADGFVTFNHITDNNEELNNHGRLFSDTIVAPHSGIGYHTHKDESEIIYVLEGEAEYSDNGQLTTIKKGDVTITPSGFGHSINNKSDLPFRFIALIIYS